MAGGSISCLRGNGSGRRRGILSNWPGIAVILARPLEGQWRTYGPMRVWKELPLGKRGAGEPQMLDVLLTFPTVVEAGE